ncbi:MAG: RNA polymerase sigma factor [Acidobacteriota bacterium]
MNATDNSLMEQVSQGQVRQLAVLFERHHRALFRYFVSLNRNRDLSEDLVQDVFCRMLRYRLTYQTEQPFLGWMYQIARNASVDHFRKSSGRDRVRMVEIDSFEDRQSEHAASFTSAEADPEEQVARRQDQDLLHRALDQLPKDKREVLILSRLQGMKHAEIAAVLGCELGTVKVRVFRAMRALEQIVVEISDEKVVKEAGRHL